MFQDGSVKTILTRSHKAPQATLHPRSPGEPEPFMAGSDPILPHRCRFIARLWIRRHPATTVEFISTASASTISSLLTLFPKCFSSFLHSTCSLSVSHIYLALEEVYLPLRAAIQNNPTLRSPARLEAAPRTGLSPSMAFHSRNFCTTSV